MAQQGPSLGLDLPQGTPILLCMTITAPHTARGRRLRLRASIGVLTLRGSQSSSPRSRIVAQNEALPSRVSLGPKRTSAAVSIRPVARHLYVPRLFLE